MRIRVGRFFPAPLRRGPDEQAAYEEFIRHQRDIYGQGFEKLREAVKEDGNPGLTLAAGQIDARVKAKMKELREAACEVGILDRVESEEAASQPDDEPALDFRV